MKVTSRFQRIFNFACLSVLFGALLNSCGGGNLPAIKATSPIAIMGQRNIPDEDIEIPFNPSMAMSPDGGVAIMRTESKKKIVIEHYSPDTLGVDWAINLEKEKGDSWDMQMRYRNGLLYCMGPYVFADGDSVELHRRAACRPDARFHVDRQIPQLVVAVHGFGPRIRDSDDRLLEIFVAETDGL